MYINWQNELTYKGTLFISVGKWDTVQVLGRCLVLFGDFAFNFLQNYTVKWLDN